MWVLGSTGRIYTEQCPWANGWQVWHLDNPFLLGISVVATEKWVELVYEATTGSAQKAKELHNSFAVPLMDAIYEYQLQRTPISSTASNKEALVQLGELRSSWVRPPAISADKAKKEEIRRGLIRAGLISDVASALKVSGIR